MNCNTEKRGRKRIEESLKKVSVQIYIERHKIDELGGLGKVRNILLTHIENKIKDGKESN